ncbi:MAG TPA: hypothetical protein VFZ58_02000 [Candidatus Saccharimonadales bacterium]
MTTLETPHSAVLLKQQIDAIEMIVPFLPEDEKRRLAVALMATARVASFSHCIRQVEKVRDLKMSMLVPSADLGIMNNCGVALNLRSALRADCFARLLHDIGVVIDGMSDAIRGTMCGDKPAYMAGISAGIEYVPEGAYVSLSVIHKF